MLVARSYSSPLDRGTLRALAGLGAELTVLVPDVSASAERSRFESEGGIRIVPVPAHGDLARPDELRWSRRAIRRAIRDLRPELIHLEEEPWSHGARQAAREAFRARIPLIAFSRIPWPAKLPAGASRRRRLVMAHASAVAAASMIAADALREHNEVLPIGVVAPLGVDVPSAPVSRNEGTVSLGVIGRLVPERAVDVVLRAMVPLGAGCRLLISGTGPEQIGLEQLAERLGIAAHVTWLGAQPRAQRLALLQQLDLLVAAPREYRGWRELYATPVMHAMAHGIPVIGSRNGILPELLNDAGVLVPSDDVEMLTAALDVMVHDPVGREATGAAGRRRAQEVFSHSAVAERTLTLWQQVAAPV